MARLRPRRRPAIQASTLQMSGALLDREQRGDVAPPPKPPPAPKGRFATLRGERADPPPPEAPRRIGIVFVHGIGSQAADYTLIEWASPLVRAISAWQEVNHEDLVGALVRQVREAAVPLPGPGGGDVAAGSAPAAESAPAAPAGAPAATTAAPAASDARHPQPLDPVANATIDFTGNTFPIVQLAIPGLRSQDGTQAGRPQTWFLTEAWWSPMVEPPSFATMVDWCGRQGIVARVAKGVIAEERRTGLVGRLARAASAIGVGLFLSTMTTLALIAFGLLKAIASLVPIDAVKDATIFASFETFLTTWWGDTYVLLRNPVEAANIRGRVGAAILELRARKVDAVVVIGHSGGTIVSYTALSDPGLAGAHPNNEIAADLLVTHAEAINLARTLTARTRTTEHEQIQSAEDLRAGRLASVASLPTADRTNPDGIRTKRWIDFWANRDPAPNGPLAEAAEVRADGSRRVDSREIWNRMSMSEDHGGYWDNDEEFVMPLLREIDVAGMPRTVETRSRFATYGGNCGTSEEWAKRHRQRVWTLAFWRRLMFVIPFATILLGLLSDNGFFKAVTGGAGEVARFLKITDSWEGLSGIVGSLPILTRFQGAWLVSAMMALGIIVVGAFIHTLGQIGRRSETWGRGTFWPGVGEWAASIGSTVVFAYVFWRGANGVHTSDVILVSNWFPGFQPDIYAVGGGLGILVSVIVLIVFIAGSDQLGGVSSGPQRSLFAGLATGLVLYLLAAIAISFLTDDRTREWIVGTVVTALVFRQVSAFGARRWVRWDENERELARRLAPSGPSRVWPAIQGFALIVGTLIIAASIALGDGVGGFDGTRLFIFGVAWLLVSGVVMTVVDGARSETVST